MLLEGGVQASKQSEFVVLLVSVKTRVSREQAECKRRENAVEVDRQTGGNEAGRMGD